jgi:hypothetical protein
VLLADIQQCSQMQAQTSCHRRHCAICLLRSKLENGRNGAEHVSLTQHINSRSYCAASTCSRTRSVLATRLRAVTYWTTSERYSPAICRNARR